MATRMGLRSLYAAPIRSFQPTRAPLARTFIALPGTDATTLTETRILPYKSSSLYTLIADVDNYSKFLPYCQASTVTKWSSPDADGKKWPAEADLKVGWGGYEETFTSRLFCLPDQIVEALGGEARPTLSKKQVPHHAAALDTPGEANRVFQSLSTRWTVRPFHYKPPPTSGQAQGDKTYHPARDHTEVHLTIDFQFSNPIYAALSKAVAPKVAGVMIEAFERRARTLLGGPAAAVSEKMTSGSLLGGNKIGV
ncbi:MAG: hypothetical protein M1818_003887 [Claussenomyces sp. TS43310]|nr:MAG: hypothetical protein M1818_003887 [Claussenomyces sp. TS43310]